MSQRWTAIAVTVAMSIVWIAFILHGSPWTGLMWVLSLALAAAVWANRHGALSSRSVGQVIADLESEHVRAIAAPAPAATAAPKHSALNQGDRT